MALWQLDAEDREARLDICLDAVRYICSTTGTILSPEEQQGFSILGLTFSLQGLNSRCKQELAVVGEQYPFEPLVFLPKTLRLTFAEGIQMLQEAGYDVSAWR